jgi:ketosteroid isomerase-like protein
MNKTHVEIVENADMRFVEAVTQGDPSAMLNLLHPDMVFTNEAGQVFHGLTHLPVSNPMIYQVHSINVMERSISVFNTVAVVNTLEKRIGLYHNMSVEGIYRLTRVWKFNSRQWQLIAASIVQI